MPLPAIADDITIAHLTDPHLFADPGATLLGVNTDANLRGVIAHMRQHSRAPSLLLATGDLTQDGSPEGYARFLQEAGSLQVPIRALPGNHDVRAAFHAALGTMADPVIELPHWRIVLLDSTIPGSNDGSLDDDQLDLLAQLAQSGDPRHVLVAMHHNPVPLRSQWLDTMTIANADALFAQLDAYPQVRGLLWGHVHQAYDDILPLSQNTDGRTLQLMATPATCFQFGPRSQEFSLDTAAPGYRWITLRANGDIDTQVVRVSALAQTPDMDSQGY